MFVVFCQVTKVATSRALPENTYHSRPRPEPNMSVEGKLEPSKYGSRLFFWNWWGSSRKVSHLPKPWALSNNSQTYTLPIVHKDAGFSAFICVRYEWLLLDRAHVSWAAVPPASSNIVIKEGRMDVWTMSMNPNCFPEYFCKWNKWTNATYCYYCCQIKKR